MDKELGGHDCYEDVYHDENGQLRCQNCETKLSEAFLSVVMKENAEIRREKEAVFRRSDNDRDDFPNFLR